MLRKCHGVSELQYSDVIELRNEEHQKIYHKKALEISADVPFRNSYSTVHETCSIFLIVSCKAKEGK